MTDGSSVLNTPIKKIRNLTLHSPGSASPIYPNMSEFDIKPDSINSSMLQMGYSQTLSNKVLRELDLRASEISNNMPSISFSNQKPPSNKRYSGTHRPLFSKMESISSHYAASRANPEPMSSATKKRRTLNGPEEFFALDDDSPTKRKIDGEVRMDIDSVPNLAPARPSLAPPSLASPRLNSFPVTLNSSPVRGRISPSKGSMNLNKLLSDDSDMGSSQGSFSGSSSFGGPGPFAKPDGPVKLRQTSLQMAGVHGSRDLHHKPSGSNLHKKPSIPSLQKKPSTSSLQKPSVPSLQKKPSIPSLQKKPSIPSLQKKPSIPSLQKKPSVPSFQKPAMHQKPSIPTVQKKPSIPSLQKPSTLQKPSSTFQKPTSVPRVHNGDSSIRNDTSSLGPRRSKEEPRNVTVPKPFSLYNKPTISSSQKSLGSLASSTSQNSLSSSASQRSMNRFQKFKSRFA